MAAAEAAPEELSTIANVMPAPPMPFVPEEQHGKLVVMALMAYAGDAEAGRARRSRRSGRSRRRSPTCSGRCRTRRSIPPEDDAYHPIAGVDRTMFIDHVDAATARS